MEQSPIEAFNQCTVVTVYDEERIKNLVANRRFAKVSFNIIGDNEARLVFTTSKKGKLDQVMAYLIKGAQLSAEQASLLTVASLQEKK